MRRQLPAILVTIVSTIVLVACQPNIVTVEVTQPVEVTRVVEATPQPTEAPPVEYHLTVLHTSENHGHWEPFTPFGQPTQGGIAPRAALVKQIRAEGGNLLLLDSGDVSQGTLYYTYYRGTEGRDFVTAQAGG